MQLEKEEEESWREERGREKGVETPTSFSSSIEGQKCTPPLLSSFCLLVSVNMDVFASGGRKNPWNRRMLGRSVAPHFGS